MKKLLVLAVVVSFLFCPQFSDAQTDPVVKKIIEIGKKDNRTMKHLDVLTNRFGGRPIGSAAYDNSAEWAGRKFKEWGMEYVLAFPFKNERGIRTTHYLIFISKHILGYNIMKGIMGPSSSHHPQGVPSFEYNPAANKKAQLQLF